MHAYQMHDRLTVMNRPQPYLDSLGIGGGEVDGTAVMESGQATVVLYLPDVPGR